MRMRYKDMYKEKWFRSSDNVEFYYDYSQAGGGVFFTIKEGEKYFEDYISFFIQNPVEELKRVQEKLKFELEEGKHFLNAPSIEPGQYTVVLDPTFYHNNACYYAGKLDQKIFHEKINLVDTRFNEEKGLFHRFDDEGNTLAEKLPVIENGVFKSIFYDNATAKKYSKKSTGSRRREYNTSIRSRSYHLDFEATGETTSEVFEKYPKVIVAIIAGGGDTSSNGDYSSPVQVAFMVENGKVAGRLENLNVNNSIDKMMGDDFIAVTNDQLVPINKNPFVCLMNAF